MRGRANVRPFYLKDGVSLPHQPFDTQRILLAAKSLGLSAKAVKQDPERITKAPLSVIEQDKNVKPHREVGRDVSSFTRVSEIAKNF